MSYGINLNEPTIYSTFSGSRLGLAYMTPAGEVIGGAGLSPGSPEKAIFLGYTPPDLPILGSISVEVNLYTETDTSSIDLLKYVFYPLTDDISLGFGLGILSVDTDNNTTYLTGITPYLSMTFKLLNL